MRVLAVDIGSSSVRAALVDRDGVIAPGSLSQLAVELAVEPGRKVCSVGGRARVGPGENIGERRGCG